MKHTEMGDAATALGTQDLSDMSQQIMETSDTGHKDYFYWSNHVALFFKIFDVHSTTGLCVAAIVFAILTITFEGFKCLRLNIAEKAGDRTNGVHILSKTHLVQTMLFTCEMVISYFIMLTVMTYNGWLFLAVLAGSAIGYTLCQVLSRRHASQIRNSLAARSHPLSEAPIPSAKRSLLDTQPAPLDSRRTASRPPEVEDSLLQRNGHQQQESAEDSGEQVEMVLSSV